MRMVLMRSFKTACISCFNSLDKKAVRGIRYFAISLTSHYILHRSNTSAVDRDIRIRRLLLFHSPPDTKH